MVPGDPSFGKRGPCILGGVGPGKKRPASALTAGENREQCQVFKTGTIVYRE